ncbi:DNA-methyltransferase [Protaetiibacter mangrovi]|uniref:Methyltransferase n=1 Tax=Protaetiibacter mangrovi TaxID=2970926 RepID=A0ABT1ZCG8_9MICO|nr:site-specific DNA-methyltransferase [Protaetiibacter mangrovi]MCS0498398.1 site-specific DNA-methyltransferase [Protaetiibacter mangrovi]TPX02859.1 site-specific DNA-methyltransferase [Schumannella luteola]
MPAADTWGPGSWDATSPDTVLFGDNLRIARALPDESFRLVYLDPPFNTGRAQRHRAVQTVRDAEGDRTGYGGERYRTVIRTLYGYDDRFEDYWAFLEPRLAEAWRLLDRRGTLYLHLDYREAHYAKVALDALFGRDCFLNEIVWAYDYGGKSNRRWPAKHDTILVYVKDPAGYYFDNESVDREPYMAPGLVTPEKAARGKLPTDVWWHTIVTTNGAERTGYPTQKPEGVLRRIVQASSAPGDAVLDLFAGSGTTGAVASALGRRFLLVDANPDAVEVMRARLPHARVLHAAPPVAADTLGA